MARDLVLYCALQRLSYYDEPAVQTVGTTRVVPANRQHASTGEIKCERLAVPHSAYQHRARMHLIQAGRFCTTDSTFPTTRPSVCGGNPHTRPGMA
eukprot:3033159-Rhodomonas_salina.6